MTSMTRQVAAASWAVLGKEPGTKEDYSALWASARAPGERAWTGIPSTPELGGTPGPGQLPWVTFTPHLADGQYWMATTVIDMTRDRDAVGRPVAAIRYAELSFAGFARRDGDCVGLYKGFPAAAVMVGTRPDEPLHLDLGGLDGRVDPVATASALDSTAVFTRAAKLAALILSGPVLITLSETGLLPVTDRLREFDRVLALLPFGMRSAITLASWLDGTQPTRFRLAFGRVAGQGQALVPYGENDIPGPREGTLAAGYLTTLLQLRERSGVPRLVRHLASHRWPLSLSKEDVREASEILRSLPDPLRVLQAAKAAAQSAGHGVSADRIAVARESAERRLDQDAQDDLESALLAMGGSAARQAVTAHWSARTAELAAAVVLGELARPAGYAGLDAHRWSPSLWRLRAYAAQQDSGGYRRDENAATDAFLAALTAARTREGAAVPASAVAACLDLTPPRRGQLPRLHAALLSRPPVARWVLRWALRHNLPSAGWIDWLGPRTADAPPWLRRYQVIAAAPGLPLPSPAGVAAADNLEDLVLAAWLTTRDHSLAWLGEDWWPVLTRVARGRVGQTVPDDSPAPAADLARLDLGFLISAKELVSKTPDDFATNARIDTVRLYLGLRPAHYPLKAGRETVRKYLDALWTWWSRPPAVEDAAMLTVWLLTAALGGTRRYPKPHADPLSEFSVTLLRDVVSDPRIPLTPQVADAIAAALGRAPRLLADPRLTSDWWSRIEQLRPDVRTPDNRLRAALRQADPPADPAEVAVLAGRAVPCVPVPEELADIIRPWLARRPAPAREALFRIIEGVVRLADLETGRSSDDYLAVLAARLEITEEKPGILRRRRNTQP